MPSKPLLNRFEPGKYYHVFNRGNNKEVAFYDDHAYYFFLDKYQDFLADFVDTLAYVLMPNHYHFLIRVKDSGTVKEGKVISNQFRKLSLTYTIRINSMKGRTGAIFTRGLRKKTVDDMNYLKHLVFYIHYNPQKHNIVKDYRNYNFSSYKGLSRNEIIIVNKELVLSIFNDDVSEFRSFHKVLQNENQILKYLME